MFARHFLIILFLGICVTACSNPAYQGPVSDHFDGKHFYAPEPIPNKSFLNVLKWRLTSHRTTWSNWVNYDVGVKPVDRVNGKGIKATFINHSTFLIQTAGLNMLTDPIWSERASPFSFWGPKRVHAPGIDFDQLPRIDVVMISHSHYDHLDMQTVKKLVAKDNPLFIVPQGVDTLIRNKVPAARLHATDWGQSVSVSDTTITAEPAQHWSARWLNDRNETLWASYVIKTPDAQVYFAGDSGYASGQVFRTIGAKYGSFDLAFLPIGAYEPRWFMAPAHMNPAEAVQVYQDLHAKHAIAMHFGTFQLTDEGMDQPVTDLAVARDAAGLTDQQFMVLKPGMSWER
jgi:L-ascorbate metabolism protein UlaG (beta-lactamase superfamily)